jgi:GntR family phosphonate transport system transcriptional regulator
MTIVHRKATAGPTVWQRIADALRSEIAGGRFLPGSRLPAERQLAEQYGASRMTTRRALAVLEADGLIRVEHGNGTFVANDALVRYQLGGDRIRFNQSLVSDTAVIERTMLGHTIEENRDIAVRLGLDPGQSLIALEMLTRADGHPVAHGVHWSNAGRFATLAAHFKETGSITTSLKRLDVADYRRKSTEITARLPTAIEARHLAQSKLRPVLAYLALDVDLADRPLAVVQGCFASDRVAVVIDPD